MEARVLQSFAETDAYKGTATKEEREHIARIVRLGGDSPWVSAADIERAIEIIDREYDRGHVVPEKVADAHLILGQLNATLIRKRAEAERKRQILEEGQRNGTMRPSREPPAWWQLWRHDD
jgi:hypothetical protein